MSVAVNMSPHKAGRQFLFWLPNNINVCSPILFRKPPWIKVARDPLQTLNDIVVAS